MPSPIITIGDALVKALRSSTASWPVKFQVERRYIVETDLEDLGYVTVSVFPRELEKTLGDRKTIDQVVGLNIGFQKRVKDARCKEELDPLLNLVDAVMDWCLDENQNSIGGAKRMLDDTNRPQMTLYVEEALRLQNEFRSTIILTFDAEATRGD